MRYVSALILESVCVLGVASLAAGQEWQPNVSVVPSWSPQWVQPTQPAGPLVAVPPQPRQPDFVHHHYHLLTPQQQPCQPCQQQPVCPPAVRYVVPQAYPQTYVIPSQPCQPRCLQPVFPGSGWGW